jgi:hypothetical protein
MFMIYHLTKYQVHSFNGSLVVALKAKVKQKPSAGFEVLTAAVMKSYSFRNITPCGLVKVNSRFGRTYCLHLHSRRMSKARNPLD